MLTGDFPISLTPPSTLTTQLAGAASVSPHFLRHVRRKESAMLMKPSSRVALTTAFGLLLLCGSSLAAGLGDGVPFNAGNFNVTVTYSFSGSFEGQGEI
jgi:hypothetical protein